MKGPSQEAHRAEHKVYHDGVDCGPGPYLPDWIRHHELCHARCGTPARLAARGVDGEGAHWLRHAALSIAGDVVALLALLVTLAAVVVHWRDAHGAEPRTVAFDYRNSPDWKGMADFDVAVLSPRAAAAAESLSARGLEVWYWLQPLASTWKGTPVRDPFPYDRGLWQVLDETNGVARRADGDTAVLTVDDVSGAVVLDLARPEVRAGWIALVRTLGRPTLLDYGCRDISWEGNIGLSAEQWTAWAAGWTAMKDSLDAVCQCNRWQDACAGIVLEKIGWSLTPIPKAWEILRDHPGSGVTLAMVEDDRRRRAIAAIAILTDSGFNWGFATSRINRRAPEFFGLHLGTFYDTWWERAPGVYMRLGTHGGAVLNLSGSAFKWGKHTIANEDALIFQRKDVTSGKWMTWRTTGP